LPALTLLLISAASVPAVSAATAHDAISIDGNSGFTSANGVVSGTGTDLDPYIIEGWSINAPSSECITILNTDAYFIIRDCVLEFSGYGPHIKLDNVTNGRIEWNAISNNGNGIYLSHSSSNTIANNTISSTALGISLSTSSSSNTIANNTVSNALFDIAIANSNDNIISGNTVTNASSNGIRIYSSSGNQVTWNALLNNSINAYDATASSTWDFNLYSDYTGPDDNNDGIGDIPYNITGGSRQDPHPIVLRPPAPDITSFSPANASVVPGTGTITAEYSSSSASINASACLLIVNSIDVTASASFGTSDMSYSYSLPSGTCTVALMVADAYGSTWCNWSFTVDATPPEVQIVAPANATYADGNVPINVSASDATAGMGIVLAEVDGAYNVTLVLQGSFYVNNTLSLPDGHHLVRIFANDSLGNMNSTVSVWFTVDTTPPGVVIVSPTNTTYAHSNVPVNVSVSDLISPVASVLAEVDLSYNLTLTLSGGFYVNDTMLLEDGHHVVRIYAIDSVGNANSSQYIWFTVDTTPPEVTIISPANTTYPYTPVVNASVADALSGVGSVLAEVDCLYNLTLVLQGGFYVNDTMLLADGVHQLRIFVNDTVGNSNSSSAAWFTVDTTPPEVTIVSPTNTTYAHSNVPVNVSITDAYSPIGIVLAEVDGAYNVTLVLQGSFYVNNTLSLPDGHHLVRIFANDTMNNMNSTESVWFTVDTTPPEVEIISPANASYTVPSIAINASVIDATSPLALVLAEVDLSYNLTLVLQGGFYINDTMLLEDGHHVIRIFAADIVGNTNSTESVWLLVDTTPPEVAINSPENITYPGTPSINASVADAYSPVASVLAEVDLSYNLTLVLQGSFYVNNTLSLPDGHHLVRIFANDSAGNMNSTVSVWFTVDTTPPEVTIAAPEARDYASPVAHVSVLAADLYSGISIALAEVDSSYNVTLSFNGSHYVGETLPLPDGLHTIRAFANDTMGNTNGTESVTFNIDTTLPVLSNLIPQNGSLTNWANQMVYLNYYDNNTGVDLGGIRLLVDGIDVTGDAMIYPDHLMQIQASALPEGVHTIAVRVPDAVGNTATAEWNFTVDTEAPVITVMAPAGGSYTSSLPEVSASYSDGGSGIDPASVRISVDGIDVTSSASVTQTGITYAPASPIADGTHTASVTVSDNAGNTATATRSFYVDTEGPELIAFVPGGIIMSSHAFNVWLMFRDNVSGMNASSATMAVDGTLVAFVTTINPSTGACSFSYSGTFADGTHTASVTVSDNAGNTAAFSIGFSVDTSAPAITGISPPDGSLTASGSPTIGAQFLSWRGIDESSAVIRVDGTDVTASAVVAASGFTLSMPLSDGVHVVYVEVSNIFGNAASASWSFTVDTTAPQITGMSPASGAFTNNSRPAISASFSDALSGINTTSVRLLINGTDATPLATVTSSGITYVPATALPDGIATVTVTVSDNAGNTATATATWTIDTKPPTVPTSATTNGSTVTAGAWQFSASFSGIGQLPGSVHLFIDGIDVTSSASVTQTGIAYNATLPAGNHTITLVIADAAGNTASTIWAVAAEAQPQGTTGAIDPYLVIAVVIVCVFVLLIFILAYRRKK